MESTFDVPFHPCRCVSPTSWAPLICMIKTLIEELGRVGLQFQ